MARRKATKIRVVCLKGIATEMARYDGAKIVSETLVDDSFWQHLVERFGGDMDGFNPDNNIKYRFEIECPYGHTDARWRSFGVKVEVI